MRKISVADLQNLGAVAEPAPYGDKVYWGMELPPVYVVVDPLPLVPYYYYYNSCACGQDEVHYYSQNQSYHSYLYCYYVTSSYTTEVWYCGGEGYTGSSDGGSEIPTIDLSNVFLFKNEESRVQLKPLVEDFYDTIMDKV